MTGQPSAYGQACHANGTGIGRGGVLRSGEYPTLDPATTHETLATIFGALRLDPARTPAQQQIQRDAGALMIAALGPSNPIEAAYAVRATATHYASMECFRRTTSPDTPDNMGQRWFGKALALSRMLTDMIDALTDCQEATPQAQQ